MRTVTNGEANATDVWVVTRQTGAKVGHWRSGAVATIFTPRRR